MPPLCGPYSLVSMDAARRATHTRDLRTSHKGTGDPVLASKGRPHVGVRIKAHMPPWVHRQIEALRAGPWGSRTRAGVTRDLVIVGLLALKGKGVQAPGFDPEAAIREAVRKGEPTSTALDTKRRARAKARPAASSSTARPASGDTQAGG